MVRLALGTAVPGACSSQSDLDFGLEGQVERTSVADEVSIKLVLGDVVGALELAYTFSSGGGPFATCGSRVELNRRADFQNLVSGSRIILEYNGFVVDQTAGAGGEIQTTMNGLVGISCVGSVTYETLEPLISQSQGCPTAGRIRVRIANVGQTSVILFREDGGVDFIADDGTLLRTLSSCDDIRVPPACQG